jgi:hypothetical protein
VEVITRKRRTRRTINKREQKKDENWKKTPLKEGEVHEKKVKGCTWNCCKLHMAWCNHKEGDCQLGK